MECGSGASADAEAALQHSKQVSVRHTPLPQRGRGAGGEGKKTRALRTQRTQAVYPLPGFAKETLWGERRTRLVPAAK